MQRKKRDNITLLVIIILALIIAVFFIGFYDASHGVVERREIPVHVGISDVTGLKVENESLDFGRLIPGSSAHKTITFENSYDFPILVEISLEGNVSEYVVYEPEFRLNPGESKREGFDAVLFLEDPFGEYTGVMSVIFKKAK